jgi:hypothetical protein
MVWAGPEIPDQVFSIRKENLDQVYFIPTENLSIRNSGPGVFHSYRNSRHSRLVQKFWTRCISIIQKMWDGPKFLDYVYFIHTENLAVPEILDHGYFINTGTDNLGCSRNSGPVVFHSYRKSELVQKYSGPGVFSFTQEI